MTIRKYRERPVVIEAMPLTETNAAQVVAWINSSGQRAVIRGGDKGGSFGGSVIITTLEAKNHHVSLGDYVIKGIEGEFYSCRSDIFFATYEPAPDAA